MEHKCGMRVFFLKDFLSFLVFVVVVVIVCLFVLFNAGVSVCHFVEDSHEG